MTISVLIAFENALVIITIWKDPFKQLKGTPANYLILNLAICDLLIGIPAKFLSGLHYWCSQKAVFFALFTTAQLACCASCLTILGLAVERLIVISFPLRNTNHTTFYLILGIVSIWFFAGLAAFLPLIKMDSYLSTITHFEEDPFGIPVIFLILTCYTRIYFLIRKSLYREITTSEAMQAERRCLTESAQRIENLKRMERSVARTVLILGALFLGCWAPVFVLKNLIMNGVCNSCNLWFWVDAFTALHALLNPLAYALCEKKFLRALWKICQGLCNHGNSETPESTRFPCGTIFP